MGETDAVIIAGDAPQEVLGKDEREKVRLTIDGIPASLPFLRAYFAAGRDAGRALAALNASEVPFVSLNGPYLCQYLESQGFRTELVPLFGPGREQLDALLARAPKAAVISTTFLPFARQIDAIAGHIKAVSPRTIVIAGGIQVWKSFRHRELLDAGRIPDAVRAAVCEHNYLMDPFRPSPVDVFVVSDSGEETLARLLARLRDGRDYAGIDNLACFRDGAWRLTRIAPETPREVRVDWGRFLPAPTDAFVPIQAGLGCGFGCTFCDFSGLRPVRARPAASIVDEIRTIPPRNGVRRVYFTDDNLFPNRRRAREVCRALIDADLSMRWRGLMRVSAIDEDTAALMARSGCLEVLLGIESGDAGMLRRMRKRLTPEEVLDGVRTLTRHGISTKSTFIVGFPGETDETLANTAALLNAYPDNGPALHRYLFFLFAVLPLSEVASAESRARHGLKGYGYEWVHDTMDAARAARALVAVQDAIKPQLSPSYVLEVPEFDGLSVDDIRRAYVLRGTLARLRRGLLAGESEPDLWNRLEGALRGAAAVGGSVQPSPRACAP